MYPTVSYAFKENYLNSFREDYQDFVKDNSLPNKKDSKFEVKYFARVEKVVEKSSSRIGALNDYHIWTKNHVKPARPGGYCQLRLRGPGRQPEGDYRLR